MSEYRIAVHDVSFSGITGWPIAQLESRNSIDMICGTPLASRVMSNSLILFQDNVSISACVIISIAAKQVRISSTSEAKTTYRRASCKGFGPCC